MKVVVSSLSSRFVCGVCSKFIKEVVLKRILAVACLLMLLVSICVVGQQTLATVLARGKLIVGVNAVLPGFGALDTATGE